MKKWNAYWLILLILLLAGCMDTDTSDSKLLKDPQQVVSLGEQLKLKAGEALTYCKTHKYNTDYVLLIDMSLHSGKKRLFVYDFMQNKVMRSALCAHGCGKGERKSTGAKPLFGNEDGSLLTSLGKYKIGARAYSQYGIHVHYKLHGLESTNSNAYQRIVVLHSHTPLSPIEIYPSHLPMGWSYGCPVTDNETMEYLDQLLSTSKKPVLLWIYSDAK